MQTHTLRRAAGAFVATLVALLVVACGGHDYATPQAAPTIASFSATPAAVPAGGGPVVLSWSSTDAGQLVIDNGVGDVSGSTSKTITVLAGTTFTLTASNANGTVTATTAVAVAAPTAPTITSFIATPATLPLGGGGVTLSWATAGATQLSIDNGVGDVSTLTSKAVNVTADTTFTLSATNAVGTVTKTTAVVLASANQQFLDVVNGSDSNPCTAAAPCRTLTKAIGVAAPGTTFSLADGMYSAATEGHPGLIVPDGSILRAVNPGAVTLASMAITVPTGSASFDGVAIGPEGPSATYCGSIGVGQSNPNAPLQTLTLNGVSSNCVDWLVISGNTKATMTPGSLPGGVYTTGINGAGSPSTGNEWLAIGQGSELLIQGGVIEGSQTGKATGLAGVLYAPVGATLTLDGVTLRNWTEPAIFATQSVLTLRNGTLLDHVGEPGNANGCAIVTGDRGSSLTMDHSTLSNVPGIGLCIRPTTLGTTPEPIQLTQSTITQVAGAAIKGNLGGQIGPAITADGLSLVDNGWAIYWLGGNGSTFDLRNVTITGSTATATGAGIYMEMEGAAVSFKLRGSTVSNNVADGLLFSQFTNGTVDLGTAADPGANTFTGNGTTALHIDAFGGQATVNAVGNTWTASQQGTDGNGRYSVPPSFTPVPKTGPAGGVNFTIENAVSTLNL